MPAKPKELYVPWRGIDLVFLLLLWLAAQATCKVIVDITEIVSCRQQSITEECDCTQCRPFIAEEVAGKHHGHPAAQLITLGKESFVVFLFLILGLVIAAPLVEELLFRKLFQGWVEAKFSQLGLPGAGFLAIVLVSFIFSALHAGNVGAMSEKALFMILVTVSIANLLVFAVGMIYLMKVSDMTLAQCLFSPKRFSRKQLMRMACLCLLAIILAYGISFAADWVAPDVNTAPIPLFFVSLAIGVLYWVTRNLWYCILFHACLNLTSLVLHTFI